MTRSNDVLISSSEHYEFFFDKSGLIAELYPSTFKTYLVLKGELGRYGFFPYADGKDKGIKKIESNHLIKFSWNEDESTLKFRFEFRNGFPPFEKRKTAENFILNHPALRGTGKNDLAKWEIKEFGELTLDFKDFDKEFVHNLDKTLNLLHQENREYIKKVYVDNLEVKLYMKKNGRPRLEVVYPKGEDPLPTMNKILNEKFRLQEVEYRNELYFEELGNAFETFQNTLNSTNINMAEMKEDQITMFYQLDQLRYKEQKEIEILSNQTEILMQMVGNQQKWIETQDLLIKNIQLIQEQLAQNYETLFYQNRELMGKIEEVSNKIETESRNLTLQIAESGFGFKVKHFLKELYRELKRKWYK